MPLSTNTTHRTSIPTNEIVSVSPEYQKPPTPYEDKVIPTLRNRNRADAGQFPGASVGSFDTSRKNSEDVESIAGLPITTTAAPPTTTTTTTETTIAATAAANDDATAELNQAEMIEANQMMIVFDKNLVKIMKYLYYTGIFRCSVFV